MRLKVSNVCQLLDKSKYPATKTENGITWTNNGDGTITTTGNASNSGAWLNIGNLTVILISSHKYLLCGCPSGGATNTYWLRFSPLIAGDPKDLGNGIIFTVQETTTCHPLLQINPGLGDNLVWKPQLFDLTEMYGAGNEPTTVEQFRQDFPNEMYEYSPVCWKKFRRLKYVTETKNLFKFSNEVGTLNGGFDATAQRDFEENKWYIGLIASNYYAPETILSFSINGNLIYFKRVSNASGYGIARAFKCVPNTTYTVSCKTIVDGGISSGIFISYFDKDGRILSWNTDLSNNKTITTPADCNWLVLILSFYAPDGRESEVYFTDIQLEEGSTATPYQPYGYLPLNRGKYIANKEPVQLLDKTKYKGSSTVEGITFTNNGDGTWTVVGTAPDVPANKEYVRTAIIVWKLEFSKKHFIPGHKIIVAGGVSMDSAGKGAVVQWVWGWTGGYDAANSWERTVHTIKQYPEDKLLEWSNYIELRVYAGATVNFTFKPQFFDLTEMYGAGNEPTTVEQFRADFPNELYDYNPYNAITFR